MRASQLIHRDAALAAFVGAMPSDFGHEQAADFGNEFNGDFGVDTEFEPDFGEEEYDPFGADFAGDFGYDADFGAAKKRVALARRTPATMAAWKRARTMARGTALFPNKGSDIDVERYVFSMSQAITLGTAVALNISDNPDTKIRPQRVTMNAPVPLFAFMTSLRLANVNISVGNGVEDCFNYNPTGQGMSLDAPTLSPANRATFLGNYTGITPAGFTVGLATNFSVSFRGPATLAAG